MRTLKYKIFLINGLYFEILDTWKDKEYLVKFVDYVSDKKVVLYQDNLKKGMWAKINQTYLSNYHIEIWDGDKLKEDIDFCKELKGKRVFVSFESKSLGDTISWIPYCLEFENKYECKVIVSTFLNFLFENEYPELKFVGRGIRVDNIVCMLELGWFYDSKKEPTHPATIPLQRAATNILNLEYKEIKPRIHLTLKERPIEGKYICISTVSTAQLKHWYYWQEVIDYLVSKGYEVVEISKDPPKYQNCLVLDNSSLENTMNTIYHSEFFIGLSSGLSWLSWAVGKKVVMVANFTQKDHEFQSNCIRIIDESICHGCWNNPLHRFNKGDFFWCPEHEDTPRQFECHKLITSERVILELKKLLYIE